ncbi:MAG: SusC/RagA family TonB-linked outer membrane protein, partial [Chitinophagaceae bacterium]
MKNKQRLVASILIAMRITIAQMAITIVFASSLYAKEVKSQNILEKKFSISVENKQLKKVISEIQKQTKVKFSFSANAIDAERMISFSALEKKIAEFLDETLRPYDIGYQVINERIVLFPEKRTERLVENVATAEEKIIALEKVITGAVVNDLGEPMESVSVSEKGTSNGVTTNKNGEFRISVADNNAVLVFSYVGYESKEMAVTNQVIMRVSLKAIPKAIEEVIVVGYGTQKVTKVSGAISTIKSADIDKLKPFRAEEALQGRASGVSVIQRGGPGKAPTILIRGIPSFSGTDPVVIVDGVPGSLETLSSDDIESINVLKDAASTAIYGVKGGNGVIVVTTKTGRKNRKTEFSFSANVGQQQLMNKIDVLNAEQYGIIINEGQVNSGKPIVFQDVKSLGVGTDWQDVIFKDAGVSQYSLAARGGSEKTTYYFSASYLDQAGIVGGADKNIYKRATITSNLTFNLTKKLDFIFNTAYTNTQGKSVQEGSFNAIIGNALNFDPTVPIYNTDPRYVGKYAFSNLIINELYNPAYKLENQYNKANTDRVNGKVELQYSILKNLKLTSRIGYAQGTSVGKSFGPFVFYGPKHKENSMDSTGTPISGKYNSVSESTNTSSYYTFETFGEYKYNLKDVHNFDAVVGYSLARSTGYGFSASRQDVPFNSWAYADISAATGVNSATNTNASG